MEEPLLFKWRCIRRWGKTIEFLATSNRMLVEEAEAKGFECIRRRSRRQSRP